MNRQTALRFPTTSLHTLSRRDLIKALLATTASTSTPSFASGQANLRNDPFTLGVASGSPRHDSVVLWTRLHAVNALGMTQIPQQAIPVQWQIAHDAAFSRIVQQGRVQAQPALGHAVHIDVQGLQPDRWYFYRFMHGTHLSALGRTRTFPAPDALAAKLRFAYASCQRWESGFYSAYTHMARENLDAVIFLGDYIYEYKTQKNRSPNVVRDLKVHLSASGSTLEDYRARYAAYKSDPALQAMHAHCPWIVTWDDHEVYNDYAATQGEDLSPDFMQRKAAAYQAYYENMPLRASTLVAGFDSLRSNGELRIYGQFNAGQLVQFTVLDDRQYRDHQSCPRPSRGGGNTIRAEECTELFNPQRTLLGKAQETWLAHTFTQKNAQWNVIAQQTLVGRRNYSPSKNADKALLQTDNWDGYPAARTRMTDALQKHTVSNPVFIGGDIHQNWVGHIKADFENSRSKTIATEFCGTSITSTGGNNDKITERLANNPHFIFADAEKRGYGVVELTAKTMTTQLRVLDDVRHENAAISTLASFTVESGRAVVERG